MEELNVEALTDKQVGALLKKLARTCVSMQWAVAWARPNEVGTTAFQHQAKFQHFVIGTHFFQTSPDFLEEFEDLKSAKMMLPTGATFHPKVYLFRTGNRVSAVVGSHNLTRAAFATNTEAGLLIEGPANSPALAKLSAFVKAEWLRAKPISEHLYSYRVQHLVKENARKELEAFDEQLTVRPPRHSDTRPLEWTWNEFLQEVQRPRRHELDIRRRLPFGISPPLLRAVALCIRCRSDGFMGWRAGARFFLDTKAPSVEVVKPTTTSVSRGSNRLFP